MGIIMDSNERSKNQELFDALNDAESKSLQVGDFIVGGIGIERKRWNDLMHSMENGRLWQQLEGLEKNYSKRILLIDGEIKKGTGAAGERKRMARWYKSFPGLIARIVASYDVSVIFIEGKYITVPSFLNKLDEKTQTDHKREIKPIRVKGEKNKGVLIQIPSISSRIADALIRDHHSLTEIFTLKKDELSIVEEITPYRAGKIREFLDKKW